MCDPITAGALAIGGTVAKAGSSLLGGISGSQTAKLNASIMRSNAELSMKAAEIKRESARTAGQRGAYEEARIRGEVDRTVRGATAHFAARNLDPTVGSPLLIAAVTAAQGEVDARLARARGQIERASYLADAASSEAGGANQLAQASGYDSQAQTSLLSGIFGAATSLLTLGSAKWPGLSLPSAGGAPIDLRPGWAL